MTGIPQGPTTSIQPGNNLAPGPQVQAPPSIDQEFAQLGVQDAITNADRQSLDIEFAQMGMDDANQAHGFLENTGWQALNAAKGFGDGVLNVFGLLGKSMAGGMEMLSGGNFMDGYRQAAQQMERNLGAKDPRALDALAAIGKSIGLVDEDAKEVGKAGEDLINARLGDARIFSDTVGFLASFATGPGAMIGKGAGKAISPVGTGLARLMTRPTQRALMAAAKESPELAADIAKAGSVWRYMTQSSDWKKASSILQRTAATAPQGMLSLTAANASQMFALSPDPERLHAMTSAALIAPALYPVGLLGSRIASWIAERGVTPESAQKMQQAFAKFEEGKLSIEGLRRTAWTTPGWQALGNTMGSAVEGGMFMGMSPEAWDLWDRWRAGDNKAGAQLTSMYLGTVTGILAAKGLSPDIAPMFKRVMPEANRLSTYVEAEANRRAAVEKLPEEPPNPMIQRPGESTADYMERMNQEFDRRFMEQYGDTPESWDSKRSGEKLEKLKAQKQQSARQQRIEEIHQQAKADYGWAEQSSQPLLDSGWEPSFKDGETGTVYFTMGRDSLVSLRKTETGDVELTMTPEIATMLRDMGGRLSREIDLGNAPPMDVQSSGQVSVGGHWVPSVVQELAMLGANRQMQFALRAQRLGMEELFPGIYVREGDSTHFMGELDGTMVGRDPVGNKWLPGKDTIEVVGGYGEPVWDHPQLEALETTLLSAKALLGKSVEMDTLSQAVQMAKFGRGPSADEVRLHLTQLLDSGAVFDGAKINQTAFDLARLSIGTQNATDLARSYMKQPQVQDFLKMEDVLPDTQKWSDLAGEPTLVNESGDTTSTKPLYRDEMPGETRSTERIDPSDPEAGFVDVGRGGEIPEAAAERSGRGRRGANKAVDYVIRRQDDVIARALPGDSFPMEARKIVARGAQLEGSSGPEVRSLRKLSKQKDAAKFMRQEEPVRAPDGTTVEGYNAPAWAQVVDGTSKPQNAKEAKVAAEFQKVLQDTWESSRAAGTMRYGRDAEGVLRWQPIGRQKKNVIPFVQGKDFARVMDDPALRRRYADDVAAMHQDVMRKDAATGEMRPITGEDLFNEWSQKMAGVVSRGKPMDFAESTEFFREFHRLPFKWKGYEMREPNMLRTLDSVIRGQSARTATVETWGQDIPSGERAGVAKDLKKRLEAAVPGSEEARDLQRSLEMVEQRPGVTERLSRLNQASTQVPGSQRIQQYAANLASRVQGVEPIKMDPASKFIRPYTRFSSGVMITKGFVYDTPEIATRVATFFGLKAAGKAFNEFIRNPAAAVRLAEDMGASTREMGDYIIGEAKNPAQKMADWFATPAALTERGKAGMANLAAGHLIERIKAGTATTDDMHVLEQILKFDEAAMTAMRNGLPESYEAQIRREVVSLLTSRAGPAESSAMAADPRLASWVRFTKFFTRRMGDTARTMHSMVTAGQKYGYGSRQFAAATATAVRMMTGYLIGGAAAQVLGQMLAQSFIGNNPIEGLKKFWTQLSYARTYTLAKLLGTQLVGGPIAQLFSAAANSDDPKAAWNLTVPTQAIKAVVDMAEGVYEGNIYKAWHFFADAGILPLARDLWKTPIAAALLGESQQVRNDSRVINEWRRFPWVKLEKGTGSRNKPDAFYLALQDMVHVFERTEGTDQQKLDAAKESVARALELAPGDSLAASIKAYKMLDRPEMTPELRNDLYNYIGQDDAFMQRAANHDAMLDRIADMVRKEPGTPLSDWDRDLELVTQQASHGFKDKWGSLADRAIDTASAQFLTDRSFGESLRKLATSISHYPDHLDTVLGENDLRRAQQIVDTAQRSRFILNRLERRARAAAQNDRREKLKAERSGQ